MQAQTRVQISVKSTAEIRIRIDSLPPARAWSFRNAYAGVLGIAERVTDFEAFATSGAQTGAKKIATGEFRSETDATAIAYVVKLPPPTAADVAHVSWLAGDAGFLMLADLLPEHLTNILVELSLPAGWISESATKPDSSATKPDSTGIYRVSDPEEAIFFLGRTLRRQSKLVDGVTLDAVVEGKWPFADATVLQVATKVLEQYLKLTGFKLPTSPVVMIAPLPVATGSVKWRAETRGSTVVLLLDPRTKIRNWSGQLGVIFTHELLHLWVPNALRLAGDYDWFFEGFTLYTALVTALELKFISRDEFVATLGRVYDSYLSREDGLSLIDASERRWTTGNSAVYDKGMLVAFLYDLAIRRETSGKKWLGTLYQNLFGQRAVQPANANEVIIRLLSSTPAGADLAKSYIEGQRELDLKPLLADRKQLLKSLYYK